jgi:uncharacterized protein YbbC (DUF1343 family)
MNFTALNWFAGKCRHLAFLAALCAGVHLCAQQPLSIKEYSTVITGAQQLQKLLPLLKGKRVAVVTNQTGLVNGTSIVDTLLALKVNVKCVFGPEHGFRGDTEAGEKVRSVTDRKTGLPLVSLYGANKKPTADQMKAIDVVVYDIQDLGVRFYTYISTMCYVMEACAESKKQFIVLDRPNPNGFFIDGPVLEPAWKSFLGLHPVPVVYGMTCGEYARMANGEGWLKNGAKCRLTVITMDGYDRKAGYALPVKPSPNIPNVTAVLLYPSLGLFEGTVMSLGRGTAFPFQVIGHPNYPDTTFCFTPMPGTLSREPKYVNRKCYGLDLRPSAYLQQHPRMINLSFLKEAFAAMKSPEFFDSNFNYHAGNAILQEQVKNALPESEIRNSWEAGIAAFRAVRARYLLYPDL